MVVQYIMKNRDMFEPFIEDDVPFDEYCQTMEKDGTWAGNMELQAASLVTHCNICIHRAMSPRWYIRNFNNYKARMIHLSYHDGEHYNSVRSKEDPCNGPAKPIMIKVDADISVESRQAKVPARESKGAATIPAGTIKLVMAGSGCECVGKVEEVLLQVHGDVDAAVEFLIAEQLSEEYTVGNDNWTSHRDGDVKIGHSVQVKEEFQSDACTKKSSTKQDEISLCNDKKVPRNKLCPCGSKHKYKACCGSVAAKSVRKDLISERSGSRMSKKERKQGKKVAGAQVAPSHGSDGILSDMGALCI